MRPWPRQTPAAAGPRCRASWRPTPSPPIKSLDFGGFDSSRLLILRGGILMSVNFDRGSPGKFDSRTLNRKTINRWTGRTCLTQVSSKMMNDLANYGDP